MRLIDRYRRLTFWNKLAAWSGVALLIGLPLTLFLFWLDQPSYSTPPILDSVEVVQLLQEAGLRPSVPEEHAIVLNIVAESASSAVSSTPPGRSLLSTKTISTGVSWASSSYCFDAPNGMRIVEHEIRIIGSINVAEDPEKSFVQVLTSSTRICYNVRVNPGSLKCPSGACMLAPPELRWQFEARITSAA
jgi:hypothetical protein